MMVINEKIFNGKPFAIIYLSKQEQDSQQTMDLIGKMKKRYKNNISIIYSGSKRIMSQKAV